MKKISELLNEEKKSVNGAKILLLGVSYKENVGDVRESPAFDIGSQLLDMKACLSYADPYVESFMDIKRVDEKKQDLSNYDLVVIVTAHREFDIKRILEESRLVLDCRGVTLDMDSKAKLKRL